MLLTMSPASISSPHDIAISAITRALLSLPMRRLEVPSDSSLRISFTLAPDALRAGRIPASTAATSTSAIVNSSAAPSMRNAVQNGRSACASAPSIRRTPTQAITSPIAAPTAASANVSDRNCSTMRRRLAPSAERIAISLLRTETRASSRLATLTQAMTSTRKTVATMVYATVVASSLMNASR